MSINYTLVSTFLIAVQYAVQYAVQHDYLRKGATKTRLQNRGVGLY